jgi:hypothetical protein
LSPVCVERTGPRLLEDGFENADVWSVHLHRSGPVRHSRFSASIMTYSLASRLAVTAVTGLLGLFLLLNLVSDISADDSRPAALVLLMFGIWAFVAWRFLRHLWRPDIDWAAERRDSRLRSELVKATVEDVPTTHLSFVAFPQDDADG